MTEPDIKPTNEQSTPPEVVQPPVGNWKGYFIDLGKMLLIALVLYFIIDSLIARVRVENISMFPTLKEGEVLIVNKLAYKLGPIVRGDILTFHAPPEPGIDYIKRAIGLPGDVVEIRDKKVWVNGMQLIEPYLVTPPEYQGKWVVPADNIFVLGDNRNNSSDSHIWGFVPLKNLIGKALAVYWPFTQMRILNHPNIMPPA